MSAKMALNLTKPLFRNKIPNMSQSTNQILYAAILKLIRPLIRILLRNSVTFGTFSDLVKSVYVDLASKEFGIEGRKQTISRVSILTGLNRKEVRRVKALPLPYDEGVGERYNRAARVISGWVRDSRFHDADGNPLDLPLEGEESSFSQVVKIFSGDVPVRAILDELTRADCVTRLENGKIVLKTRAYLPKAESGEKLEILGTDVRDLISTIDHNLGPEREPFFQRKVAYDNLPQEVLDHLREMSAKKAQALLEEMDHWLAQRDRDTNPLAKGSGRKRAGIGVYYFEEDVTEGKNT